MHCWPMSCRLFVLYRLCINSRLCIMHSTIGLCMYMQAWAVVQSILVCRCIMIGAVQGWFSLFTCSTCVLQAAQLGLCLIRSELQHALGACGWFCYLQLVYVAKAWH